MLLPPLCLLLFQPYHVFVESPGMIKLLKYLWRHLTKEESSSCLPEGQNPLVLISQGNAGFSHHRSLLSMGLGRRHETGHWGLAVGPSTVGSKSSRGTVQQDSMAFGVASCRAGSCGTPGVRVLQSFTASSALGNAPSAPVPEGGVRAAVTIFSLRHCLAPSAPAQHQAPL